MIQRWRALDVSSVTLGSLPPALSFPPGALGSACGTNESESDSVPWEVVIPVTVADSLGLLPTSAVFDPALESLEDWLLPPGQRARGDGCKEEKAGGETGGESKQQGRAVLEGQTGDVQGTRAPGAGGSLEATGHGAARRLLGWVLNDRKGGSTTPQEAIGQGSTRSGKPVGQGSTRSGKPVGQGSTKSGKPVGQGSTKSGKPLGQGSTRSVGALPPGSKARRKGGRGSARPLLPVLVPHGVGPRGVPPRVGPLPRLDGCGPDAHLRQQLRRWAALKGQSSQQDPAQGPQVEGPPGSELQGVGEGGEGRVVPALGGAEGGWGRGEGYTGGVQVALRAWPWLKTQGSAIPHCLLSLAPLCSWALLEDLDEFLIANIVPARVGQGRPSPGCPAAHHRPLLPVLDQVTSRQAPGEEGRLTAVPTV